MAVNSKFGKRVRTLRSERGFGLRRFAGTVGISPTYLSKIERGEFPPPAEDKVVAIADALGQDRDELLALGGRVASDLEAVILRHPRELGAFLRIAGGLSPEEIRTLTRVARGIAQASREQRRLWAEEGLSWEGLRLALDTPRDGVPDAPPEMT
jgi:transcriptional regulator with XRE-family HTH domain